MKKTITIFLILSSFIVYSQKQCNCVEILDFVSNEIETNSASFAHQVIEYKQNTEYEKHLKSVYKIAKQVKTEKECIGIIQFYLSFLRDAHQNLALDKEYYPFESFTDSIAVKKFIKEYVENFRIKKIKPKGILGNWYYKNGTYAIQIQKNHQKGRKYIGVLKQEIRNKNLFLANKGDLKIEFYENYKNELYAIYWFFNQKPSLYKVEYNDSILKFGRTLIFYRDSLNTKSIKNKYKLSNSTYFEELNSKTNYLRIHSFGGKNKKNIDSIINSNREKLLSKNNLIIDVRNNGGGTDLSYYPLLPYIMDKKTYQNPIVASSIWVSKANFDNYDKTRYLYLETKKDSVQADKEITELRKHIGGFEPFIKTTSTIDTIYAYPKKVYIIQNKGDASSTEGFILAAKQSKKVTTFGENTEGMVSYAEWRKLEIPKLPAWISMTQKKVIFYDNSDFEMIGIEPDVKLNPDEEYNWFEIVKKEIEK